VTDYRFWTAAKRDEGHGPPRLKSATDLQ